MARLAETSSATLYPWNCSEMMSAVKNAGRDTDDEVISPIDKQAKSGAHDVQKPPKGVEDSSQRRVPFQAKKARAFKPLIASWEAS